MPLLDACKHRGAGAVDIVERTLDRFSYIVYNLLEHICQANYFNF